MGGKNEGIQVQKLAYRRGKSSELALYDRPFISL